MGVVASSFDNVNVAFEERGEREPTLLFIHGLAGNRSDFRHQTDYFSTTHRVVAVDLPGNGESGTARTTWTLAAYGVDVISVADNLGLNDLILVGHSLGGDVTIEAATRLGRRVRGVVWVSSYRSLGAPKSGDQMGAWLAPFKQDFDAAMQDLARRNFGPRTNPALVNRIATRMSSADPEMVMQLLVAKQQNEATLLTQLNELDIPVVAINPDFKPNDAASLAAHGVELVIVPNVGHFAMLEDSGTFNELLAGTIKVFSDHT